MKSKILPILIYLLLSVFCITISAKKKTVYYGGPKTGGAEIHVSKNGSYEIFLQTGTYKIKEGKYLVFDQPELDNSRFSLISNEEVNKTDSITVSFTDRATSIHSRNIFVGYKNNNTGKFKYVNLDIETRLFNTNPDDETFTFKVPRTSHLKFGYKERLGLAHIESFAISENTTNVYCAFKYGIKDGSQLKVLGIINDQGKLELDERRRTFSTQNPKGNYIKKNVSNDIENWKVPILVEKEAYKKFDNPGLSYCPVLTVSPSGNKPEVAKIKSLDEALTLVKKDKYKILLIFNQLLDNNANVYFEDLAWGMPRNPIPEPYTYYNNYLIYLTKPEDRKALKKYGSQSVNEVIAINADHKTIYTEQISINNFRIKYGVSFGNKLSETLQAINTVYILDQSIKNKTLVAADFLLPVNIKNCNHLITKESNSEDDDIFEYVQIDTKDKTNNDSAQFNNLSVLSYHQLQRALLELIDKHRSDKTFDIDFGKLALEYIGPDPIYRNFLGFSSNSISNLDFEFCLYLLRFSEEINDITVIRDKYCDDNILKILKKISSSNSSYNKELILESYKEIMKNKEYCGWAAKNCYFFLTENKIQPYEVFDTFIGQVKTQESNILADIENFEIAYLPYYKLTEGNEFKKVISTFANMTAWHVVEHNNENSELLKRAINWSEISLELYPDKHSYTDTYAQLQYFAGNIEKAIQLELKAIRISKEEKDSKYSTMYEETLSKMRSRAL